MNTIQIYLKLASFQPGSRGYNNAIFEPETKFSVVIDVPLKYVTNAEEILLNPIAGDKAPAPILNIDGWAFVEDAFLNRNKAGEKKPTDENVEWEEDQ